MSGANDERWRPARGQQNPPQNPSRQNNQQQRRNVSREGVNSWQNNDRSNKDWPPSGPQEQHVPVKGFNAQEVREVLKLAYNSSSPGEDKPLKYKAPAGQANTAKQGGPWGSKPNTMAGGKDFFLELRKQVSHLQQGVERAGG